MRARDVHGDYLRAYLEEHQGYQRTGRAEAAGRVAEILRTQFGHEVGEGKTAERDETQAPERADADRPAEDTAEPKPKRRGRPRLPRDADGNVVREG